MKPGHGEVLLAEGDVDVREDEERLIEAFREQLDQGMWAAVPSEARSGRRQARMVRSFDEIPRDAEREPRREDRGVRAAGAVRGAVGVALARKLDERGAV